MILISSPSNNAYFNIATEEYLLSKFPQDDIFLLYINAPSIIVGKFQNSLAEINFDYVEEHDIKVVRRLSGGGAVYHDLGNLNFSFHSLASKEHDFLEFETFTKPVVELLNELGVPAKLEGRNDLLIEGRKFSGNAKLSKSGKVIQHGTILINSEMTVLSEALKANPLKFVDKATKSIRSRVVNLIEYLPDMDTKRFSKLLLEKMINEHPNARHYEINEEDITAINQLVEDQYSTWDWNFGKSPKYSFNKAVKLPAGFIEMHIDVEKGGFIENMKVYGDFFAEVDIESFETLFVGVKHEKESLNQVLSEIDLSQYFGKVEQEDILDLMM